MDPGRGDEPQRRRAAISYADIVGVAQIGWIVTAMIDIPPATIPRDRCAARPLELAGPVDRESCYKGGTPWHPGHIAERYGLLVIITLGEVILGTVTTISAIIVEHGWTAEAIILAFSGTALAFGIWWVYFTLPGAIASSGALAHLRLGLRQHRRLRGDRRSRRRTACGRPRDRGRVLLSSFQVILTIADTGARPLDRDLRVL